jgi:hypothetical protein
MDISDADNALMAKMLECQVRPFEAEQAQIIGRLVLGQNGRTSQRVPLIFKKESGAKGTDAYIDEEFLGRAYMAIIVQHRMRAAQRRTLRVLYYEVTGALEWKDSHFECDLSKLRDLETLMHAVAQIQ